MLAIKTNLGHSDLAADDSLTLPYELRQRGRLKSVTDNGVEVGLFLERGKVLADGMLLESDCGKRIRVRAQDEAVITAVCDDWLTFARACYHLGNRHVPLQVGERWVRFQPDHVLEEMVRLLGLTTRSELAPFDPEGGAYSGGHHHHHGENHSPEPENSHEHGHHGHSHAHHH